MTKEEIKEIIIDNFKDLGIDETFTLGYRKFKVVETRLKNRCDGCIGLEVSCSILREGNLIPDCASAKRNDQKTVKFIEVEE